MIRECNSADFDRIRFIINDAAIAYKSTIPSNLYREPWMSEDYLSTEIQNGVKFWGFDDQDGLVGVMGIRDFSDVTLIRHS